jgi:hypothetical protein
MKIMNKIDEKEWLSEDCRILLHFEFGYADAWKVCIQEENETESLLHKAFEEFEEAKEYIQDELGYKFKKKEVIK